MFSTLNDGRSSDCCLITMSDHGSSQPKPQVQVSREHYFTPAYLGPERFLGMSAQLSACLTDLKDVEFVEIGPGPGMLAALLRNFGKCVTTVDFDPELKPDVVASLPNLPLKDNSCDVSCAFEVLEHLPLDLLAKNLAELRRIARRRVIISVPSQQEIRKNQLRFMVQLGNNMHRFTMWTQRIGKLTNPKEHYWEIGHAGITPEHVEQCAREAGLKTVKSQFHRPWFHLFAFDCNKG